MRRGLSNYLHRRKSKLKNPRTNLKVSPEFSVNVLVLFWQKNLIISAEVKFSF
jgi:hypothetical protein